MKALHSVEKGLLELDRDFSLSDRSYNPCRNWLGKPVLNSLKKKVVAPANKRKRCMVKESRRKNR